MFKIPIYQPRLQGNEKKYVNDCLETNWISSKGVYVAKFEQAFAEFVGVRHALTVSNGTVALHLALVALGVGPGDEVIVPTLTYIASVNAITYVGAKAVFVDSLPDTWQMDPEDVRRKITPRTKVILAVHLYGHPCAMPELQEIATKHQVSLVEDCAEAIGSRIGGKHVGTFSDIGTFSFFGNKTITTGEGGMVVTDDETLADRMRHFKGQGLAAHREYWHDVVGYNYRMTNICAAIGLAQLEQVAFLLEEKKEIARLYRDGLAGIPVAFHEQHPGAEHSYWMCSILVEEAGDREPLRGRLARAGVETRPLFYPVHTMPMYSANFQKHPVAESLGWRGINLPSWPGLTAAQIQGICDEIGDYFRSK